MESAVPPELAVPRTRPARVPEDHQPRFPSFVARHPAAVRRLVMAYLGAQGSAAAPDLGGPDGPRHHDRATLVRAPGGLPTDTVTVGYWDDAAAFERWFAATREPWLAGGGPGEGRWVEVVRPPVERYETIFGRRSRPEGAAVLAERFSGPVREHGYWGGMRDRMPASRVDPLDDPGELEVERDGDRVRVVPRGSVCLIRSGQDWADTDGDERRAYLDVIEPHLRAGMDFLRERGAEVGCLANRYLAVLDGSGARTERTYGQGWWRSLAELERWSQSHPTHLAIFGAFGRMAAQQTGPIALRLYHEVAVARPDESWFEYVGCHDRTGLLGAVAH